MAIIIPAFNEQENIDKVIKGISGDRKIIVVDDGSKDNTARIAKKQAHKTISLKENKGKAFACHTGVKNSKDENNIFMDGDGQHDPKDISKIEKHMDDFDLVLGVRNMGDIPVHRKITNNLARLAIKSMTDKKFTDVL
ncbi:MAG: glycosyltransferase family 2 protein [Candidatus Woesearchaeota archaeon]